MKRTRAGEVVILAFILFLAFILRAQRLGFDALSMDEMWHLALSSGRGSPQISLPRDVMLNDVPSITSLRAAPGWYSVWTHVEHAVHPPLYVQTLRIWRESVGDSDLSAQWLSVVFSLAAVVITWHAARVSFGSGVALWAAAALAVAPTQVFMAQEVRGYTMLLMLGCWALSAAARIERGSATPARLVELALAVLCMMLTHYFAIGAAMAIAAWVVIRLNSKDRRRALVALTATAGIYAIIWGPWSIRQVSEIREASETWLSAAAAPNPFATTARAFLIPVRVIAEAPTTPLWCIPIGLAIVVAPLIALRRKQGEYLLWLLWLVGSVGFILALDLARGTGHLAYIRYTLLASPAVAVLVPACLRLIGPRVMNAATAVLVTLSLCLTPLAYFADAPDYNVLRQHLKQRASSKDILIFYSGGFVPWHNQVLLLASSGDDSLWPRDIVMMTRPADTALLEKLRGRRVCLISGPIERVDAVVPGAQVIEQTAIGADGKYFAICTWIQL